MRKQVIAILDDRDGKILQDGDVITRELTLDGVAYSLDLRDETSRMLNEALAPFLRNSPFVEDEPAVVIPKLAESNQVRRRFTHPAPVVPEPAPAAAVKPEPAAPAAKVGPIQCPVVSENGEKVDDVSLPAWSAMAQHVLRKHQIVPAVAKAKMDKGEPVVEPPKPKPAALPTFPLAKTREEFGQQIRAMREARGLSQGELALQVSRVGNDRAFKQSTLSRIERSVDLTPFGRLSVIARILGLEVPLGFADEPVPVKNAQGQLVYPCSQAECHYRATESLAETRGHERMAHGIGGKSAAEMSSEYRAEQAAKAKARDKERIQASVLDPLREAEGRLAPETNGNGHVRPEPVHTIRPGVNVVASTPRPRPPAKELRATPPPLPRSFAENTMEVDAKAIEYADRFKDGLPLDVECAYLDEVRTRKGFDQAQADETLRSPDWVEIAVESYTKGYPILLFHKADSTAVVGLRNPAIPMVLSYYDHASLHDDVEQVNHAGSEVRNVPDRLPRTAEEMLDFLRAAGATVEYDELSSGSSAPITYRDQELGKVPVDTASKHVKRSDVETAYQRIIRKIAAINDRELEPVG